jgi:hypothetical protein
LVRKYFRFGELRALLIREKYVEKDITIPAKRSKRAAA